MLEMADVGRLESWAALTKSERIDGVEREPTLRDIEAQIDAAELAEATKRRSKKLDKKGAVEDLVDARLPDCYKQVKDLLWIQNNPIYKTALDEWTRKEKILTSRIERKKKKADSLKNEVYQLVGFFSVFQGVVLTAVAQSNLLHCNNWWSPVLLSILASVVTIAGATQKLSQIADFQKTINGEAISQKEAVRRLEELRREGRNFYFAKFPEDDNKVKKKYFFSVYSGSVLVFLVLFAVVFPISFWRVLCHPGPNPYAS